MNDVLARIEAYKREEIAAAKATVPWAEIERRAAAAPPPRGFAQAIRSRLETGRAALIAEIKKASPSKGLIRADFQPAALAAAYAAGGAACLSVLTDGPSFQGDDSYLVEARAAVELPVLRKDFLYDPWQVVESRALGADCILIILASVSDAQAQELEATAHAWGMTALLEVHTAEDLERARLLKSRLVGINNRDLHTFKTSLTVTEQLAPKIPRDRVVVAESGLNASADLARLADVGVSTFLIGESLMRQADVTGATRAILARSPAHSAAGH